MTVDETTIVPAPPDSAELDWGGFRIHGMDVALPMQGLREVVPLGTPSRLPCGAPGVIGGLALRGVTLPIVDLGLMAGHEPAPPGDDECVVVVVHDQRLIGVRAEGVSGIFRGAPGSHVRAMPSDGRPLLFGGSIRREDTGALVTLLSLDALAALPGVPWIADPEPERVARGADAIDVSALAADEAGTSDEPSLLLIRCGLLSFAIDAMAVHATLFDPRVEPSAVTSALSPGVVATSGRLAPALDLAALTGLGTLPPGTARQGIVLQRPEGLVVCLVEEVLEIVRLPRDLVQPVPAYALPRPTLVAGSLAGQAIQEVRAVNAAVAGRDFLVLDGQALLDLPEVVSMAAINTLDTTSTPGAVSGVVAEAATGRGRAMMTFLAPGEMAVPIDQVTEILPELPGPPVFGADSLVRRIVVNRGRSIPVLGLERLLGSTPAPVAAGAAILVVNSGGHWVGFAVPRLQSIEYAHWEHALRPGPPGADPVAEVLRHRALATVGTGDDERTMPVIDLQALADAIVARGAAAMAQAA